MRADGISPDELVADIQPPKAGGKKRQPRPAKYRYTDHTGAEKTSDRTGKNAEADCRGCRPRVNRWIAF